MTTGIFELILKISGSEIKRWKQNEYGYIEMVANFTTVYGDISKVYIYSKSGLDTGNVELFLEDKKILLASSWVKLLSLAFEKSTFVKDRKSVV